MTTTGTLDFQTGEQWQSEVAFSNAGDFIAAGGTKSYPAAPLTSYVCSNWQSMQLKVDGTNDVDYVFKWWSDAAATSQLGERRFTVAGTWGNQYLTLGNLGPYVTYQVINGGAAGSTVSTVATFTNRLLAPFQPAFATPMLVVNALAVGAGAIGSRGSQYLYAGPACLTFTTDVGVGWIGDLRGLDSAGTGTSFAYFGPRGVAGAQVGTLMVEIPPLYMWVFINNFGGVALTMDVKVTADIFR